MAAKKNRTVYQTSERQALRGVRASASAWGWSWIKADDSTLTLYVNAAVAERHRPPNAPPIPAPPPAKSQASQQQLRKGIVAYRCLQCGYVEHTLICHEDEAKIPPRPLLCTACKEDTAAIHAIGLQTEWGINLGWRMPASVGEAEWFTRGERLRQMGQSLDTRAGIGARKVHK